MQFDGNKANILMKINKYRKQLIVSIIYVLLYKYIERPLINMYLEIH